MVWRPLFMWCSNSLILVGVQIFYFVNIWMFSLSTPLPSFFYLRSLATELCCQLFLALCLMIGGGGETRKLYTLYPSNPKRYNLSGGLLLLLLEYRSVLIFLDLTCGINITLLLRHSFPQGILLRYWLVQVGTHWLIVRMRSVSVFGK